ncbi:hypothetical protein HPP92_022397 [Vanilla planifolia]|uniref:Light-mediated development protein DET1 n=1 Tax=Vanilla planifolia TaxID=51239 RepID=A0A835UDL3_VANPL|nr:hypothetical protein HPP92_022397 [Vanilla planifolia]
MVNALAEKSNHNITNEALVLLEDGVILDEKVYYNDFINLVHSMGVFLYEDLLCIMSLRYQAIHILQIRESGNLVNIRMIGPFCHEDDELFLNSHVQVAEGKTFLSGVKQRLLSYIFRKHWSEEADQIVRIQYLKRKFYFHFQDYIDLIMWKVQFLDRHHLLIKFGSVDGGNSTEELYDLFEQLYDHFHAASRNSLHANFISSHSNNIYAFEQLCTIKNNAGSLSQFVKKMATSLPYTCQSQSPSPYFDLSLFRYDEKLISATDRLRHSTEHPIKFISRRQPHILKFKIKPGPETSGSDARSKRVSSFLFHPYLPLAISIQQTSFMQPTVVNIHFRR